MNTAIWIIAVCEIVRTIQITLDIVLGAKQRKTTNNAFIDSLKMNNKEWVRNTLREFEELNDKGEEEARWEELVDDFKKCSKCGMVVKTYRNYKYCPECRAKMQEVEE